MYLRVVERRSALQIDYVAVVTYSIRPCEDRRPIKAARVSSPARIFPNVLPPYTSLIINKLSTRRLDRAHFRRTSVPLPGLLCMCGTFLPSYVFVFPKRFDKGHSKRMRGRCVRVPADQWCSVLLCVCVCMCVRLARYEEYA